MLKSLGNVGFGEGDGPVEATGEGDGEDDGTLIVMEPDSSPAAHY